MSIISKFGSWLLTKKGKNFTAGAACTGIAGLMFIKVLPNTIFIDQYRDVLHFYKNGFTVPLTKPIKERFNKALDILEIPDIERLFIRPFFSVGFDVFSAGTTRSRFGSIIGIPFNFTYIDDDMVDKSVIKLRQESVPWELDDGKLLYKSLFLSENAQIYAMAREIEMCRTLKFPIDSLLMVSASLAAYGLGNTLNVKYNMYAKPRAIRVIMYGLIGAFMFLTYCFIKDAVQLHFERKIDEYLKNKNDIFKEGGKEYYEKVLMRNIALRGLLGSEGTSLYTALGNENYILRQKHLPLVQRKQFFESNATEIM
ncbi:transmembrane protein 177 [Agrilus planipennis]|uniref:Transmembrane protein 177 n=1 Tax=Agrilus planipennis TaxID=224129 RepID=A0A7F5RL24_AGRPL|nr:transmembrane protein 177 [Agrilus planipennis]